MNIRESGEMYLETILTLTKEKPSVRAIDVSERMGFSKPSVSRALGLLKEQALITVDENGHIALTETGRDVAETIYARHTVLTEALMLLGVDHDTAAADACRVEHAISDATFRAIRAHLEKMKSM